MTLVMIVIAGFLLIAIGGPYLPGVVRPWS